MAAADTHKNQRHGLEFKGPVAIRGGTLPTRPHATKDKLSGELTPTKLTHSAGRSGTASPATGSRARLSVDDTPQRPKSSPIEYDFVADGSSRDTRRWLRDRRRDSQAPIRHFDGPILQPKASKTSSRASSRAPSVSTSREHAVPTRLTYAQMLSSSSTSRRPAFIQTGSPWLGMQSPRTPNSSALTPYLAISAGSFETESEGGSSVFDDDDKDEDEHLSDFDTDISFTSNREGDSHESTRSDPRIAHPKQYFAELEDLEGTVAGNSGLFLLMRKNRQAYPKGTVFQLRFLFESHSGLPSEVRSYDEEIMNFCNDRSSDGPVARSAVFEATADLAYWAFHILECRNLMLAVISNIERMKNNTYCNTSFNCVVVDETRPNVAKIVAIELEQVYTLHRLLDSALSEAAVLVEQSKVRLQRSISLHKVRDSITERCSSIMKSLGFGRHSTAVGLWRRTVLALDLAIVSYCGAHLERFDYRYLNEDLDLAKMTPAWTYDIATSSTIMIRRRKLLCLDKMLGDKVWVLQSQDMWQDVEELYLSTDPEQLADIWGPMWSVKQAGNSNIREYRIGSGTIVPWSSDTTTPKLLQGEVYSHWRPPTLGQKPLLDVFNVHSRLLIGAKPVVEKITPQLKENFTCENKVQKVVEEFKSNHVIEKMGTAAATSEHTEDTVGVVAGAYGVGVGATRTYKRRKCVTWKSAICEQWRNNSSTRDHTILEHFIGVEVSFCSLNARRRRLKNLFNSVTILNWLKSCKQSPEPFPCEQAFYRALQSSDPKAVTELWEKQIEWRKDLGQLISWCLDGLEHTGVDDEGNLRVLWMPDPRNKMIVKLKRGNQDWTSFLTDTKDECSMVIMSRKCLLTDYGDASTCRAAALPQNPSSRHSVLETALVVNEKAYLPRTLEKRTAEQDNRPRWSVADLRQGEKLPMPHGRLKTIGAFARTRMLVHWDSSMSKKLSDATSSLIRTISREKETFHHFELQEDMGFSMKPIPMFIVSQSKLSA